MKHLIWIAALLVAGCNEQVEEKKPAPKKKDETTKNTTAPDSKKEQPKTDEKPKEKEPEPRAVAGPDDASMKNKAPDEYKVKFETTRGSFTLTITRSWAPLGADRFYNLVKGGFYDGCRFFRVVPHFMVQFGLNGNPEVTQRWQMARIQDDPVTQSNQEAFITFAMAGPNTRTTQVFINYGDNARLDAQKFSPFGKVTEGMDVVKGINAEYGEQPNQGAIMKFGNSYLKDKFPNLDFIKSAKVVE